MEHYTTSLPSPGEMRIEGLPDAVKAVKLEGPKPTRLAHLALHLSDLQMADACLEAINRTADPVMRDALWRSSVGTYIKCFGDPGLRFQLDAAKIYKNRPPEAMLCYQFFKDLRDKHFEHDENPYKACTPLAALNNGTKSYKVEKIVTPVLTFGVLGEENWRNLKLLIATAKEWVSGQYDELANIVSRELEQRSYEELAAMPPAQAYVPKPEDMGKKRETP